MAGCTTGSDSRQAATDATTTTTATRPDQGAGPLAGQRWAGGALPVETLLHDDGTTLWSVAFDGRQSAVWQHAEVEVDDLAAAPDGKRLAMVVRLAARGDSDLSSVVYVLEPDGGVRVADALKGDWHAATPVFLRPPTDDGAEPTLYWVRRRETFEVDPATGRFPSYPVVETPDGPAPVEVPLRHQEAVYALHGYPGSDVFTLALFRHNNVPTRYEILMNTDTYRGSRSRSAALRLWSDNEHRANTDLLVGAAWLTPDRYAVAVYDERPPGAKATIELYRRLCEPYGSRVAYQGSELALGDEESAAWMLPTGPSTLLVLDQAEVEGKGEVHWRALDTSTGKLTPTPSRWSPGAWTVVRPDQARPESAVEPDCAEFNPAGS